ncbi:MAG: VTT domain-containing protein [Flavobacteriaceae bacterium]|nr:VTT domain-containing protein [Flavobacteriaceae bacterium]
MKDLNRFTILYYQYLKRTGLFRFLVRNLINLSFIIFFVVAVVYIVEKYIISTKEVFIHIVDNVSGIYVYLLFGLSETFLGLIPPDLFIVWAEPQAAEMGISPWWIVLLLSVMSYLGGLLAFFIGRFLNKIPSVNTWLLTKHQNLVINLQKWGGIFIVFAALLPLPYSVATLLAGLTSYPLRWLLFLGIFRIARFFIYAIFLFYFF